MALLPSLWWDVIQPANSTRTFAEVVGFIYSFALTVDLSSKIIDFHPAWLVLTLGGIYFNSYCECKQNYFIWFLFSFRLFTPLSTQLVTAWHQYHKPHHSFTLCNKLLGQNLEWYCENDDCRAIGDEVNNLKSSLPHIQFLLLLLFEFCLSFLNILA